MTEKKRKKSHSNERAICHTVDDVLAACVTLAEPLLTHHPHQY
jgi:hypothetical protein